MNLSVKKIEILMMIGYEDKSRTQMEVFNLFNDKYPKVRLKINFEKLVPTMQQIRISLQGNGVVLMGQNTMMRKAINGHIEQNPALEKILPHIKGNVGFLFTRSDLIKIRDKLLEHKVKARDRAGAIASLSVIIPAQNTGLFPKNSFFQALSIPTKISKGSIEIINDVHILKPGDKVGACEATLLNMLKHFFLLIWSSSLASL